MWSSSTKPKSRILIENHLVRKASREKNVSIAPMDFTKSNYKFVKLIIGLIGGGQAPPSQTVGSLLRTPYPGKPARKTN